MIAEAGRRKYVLARFGKDDRTGEEGNRCTRVVWDVAGDGWVWRGSDRGKAGYVLARFGKNDRGGEEGDRCTRVIWDVAGDGWAWRGSDRGKAGQREMVDGGLVWNIGNG